MRHAAAAGRAPPSSAAAHMMRAGSRRGSAPARALASGGGGGGGSIPPAGGGGGSGDGSPQPRRRRARLVAAGAAAALLAQATAARRADVRPDEWCDTSSLPVMIIIPALNEELALGTTLRCVAMLQPPPADVVVSVGPSTDATADIAAAAGAHVVRGGRGRMNAGAAAALARRTQRAASGAAAGAEASDDAPSDAALLFLHADTRLPPDAVACVRAALARRAVVAGGFVSLGESAHKTWWYQSLHNVVKTHYVPLIARPLSYLRGLRILFGDQAIFCRAAPFQAVGGYDESVPIMEDFDLCLKLHAQGPDVPGPARDTTPGRFRRVSPLSRRRRGVIRQLSRAVATDGRRFEVWGNARGTAIHVAILVAWYFGASAAQMRRIYDAMYTDIRAGGAQALPTANSKDAAGAGGSDASSA